jgi:hypothetical protein
MDDADLLISPMGLGALQLQERDVTIQDIVPVTAWVLISCQVRLHAFCVPLLGVLCLQ